MLKRIFFAALLAVLLPLYAHAAQESRMTPELAEKVLLECMKTNTFLVLKGYNFNREEYKQLETYLHEWQKYPMYEPHVGRDMEARLRLTLILRDILGELAYNVIFECNFIKTREDESDLYFIVKNDKGKQFEIFIPGGSVIFDQKIYKFERNLRLKIYANRVRGMLEAVKIMTVVPDDGYIDVCQEEFCDASMSDEQIMALRRDLVARE